MPDTTSNPKSASRAVASSSLTFLTLITLVACLSARHAEASHRETNSSRIAFLLFGVHASLGVLSASHTNQPLPSATTRRVGSIKPAVRTASFATPSNAALRAIPPPIA